METCSVKTESCRRVLVNHCYLIARLTADMEICEQGSVKRGISLKRTVHPTLFQDLAVWCALRHTSHCRLPCAGTASYHSAAVREGAVSSAPAVRPGCKKAVVSACNAMVQNDCIEVPQGTYLHGGAHCAHERHYMTKRWGASHHDLELTCCNTSGGEYNL